MQRRAEALGRHDPQVARQSAREHDCRARRALRRDLLDLAIAHEARDRLLGLLRTDQEIEAAHRVLHAAIAARHHAAEVFRVRFRVLRRQSELEALRFRYVSPRRLEDAALGLLAEAGDAAQPPFARRALELGERADAL